MMGSIRRPLLPHLKSIAQPQSFSSVYIWATSKITDTEGVRSPHSQQEKSMTDFETTHLLSVLVGAIILTAAIFIVTRQRDDD